MNVFIPGWIPSGTENWREHWAAKHRRQRKDREVVQLHLNLQGKPPPLPVIVTFRRCSPRLLDSDNLGSVFKATRDQVAIWLGLPLTKQRIANDRDERVTWAYEQEKTPGKSKGTLIRFEARSAAPPDAAAKPGL